MLNKYKNLNLRAKEYFLNELEKKSSLKRMNKYILNRCYKEIDILYDKGLLFIIEYLHKFKKFKNVHYYFSGSTNNLLLLYILKLNDVNPIKYNLPHELFKEKNIKIELNEFFYEFLTYLNTLKNFRIIAGNFEKEDIEEINKLEEGHYLLIPTGYSLDDMLFTLNNDGIFETVDDYRIYKKDFITIKITKKSLLTQFKKIEVKNVINNQFENEISDILKPKTIDHYVKIKSLAHGANVWKNNQDEIFKCGDIDKVIANREDVYEYLLSHSIDKEIALQILKFLSIDYRKKYLNIWHEYIDLMKKHKCGDTFINIIKKINYISTRGQAVSECLFVLNKNNYINEEV